MRMFKIFRDMGRGTALAKNGVVMHLKYDSMIVSGAMMNFNWQLQAGQETACPFSFDFLVKGVEVIYGGLSGPTKLDPRVGFTPANFQLAGSAAADSFQASQTYIGTPPGNPEGITDFQLNNLTSDDVIVDPVTGVHTVRPELLDEAPWLAQ